MKPARKRRTPTPQVYREKQSSLTLDTAGHGQARTIKGRGGTEPAGVPKSFSDTRLLLVRKYECIKSKLHTRLNTPGKRLAFPQNSISEKNEHDISSLDDGLRVDSTKNFIPEV